jgi:butyryl-CoA dehydrogenase
MRIELTDEQRMIQGLAREFAEGEVKPVAAECDREARFPHATVKRMGELGLLGVTVPEKLGGAGADTVSYAVALEEIAVACASHAVIMSVNNSLVCAPLLHRGTPEQQERFLRPLATGGGLGCFTLTEPQAGSDATNLLTTARRDGAHYVLDGRKVFVTNGREATLALVFAQTAPGRGSRGISAFLVEKATPGFQVPRVEDKLGIRASDTAELVFEGCRVPAGNRLGDEGEGFHIAMTALDGGRIGIAAQALGIARERRSFNKPIGQHQQIQWMLADMATTIDAARLLTWRAATLKDRRQPYGTASSMAKLLASQTAMRVTTDAIQVHGGYGYVKEYPVERFFRDAKITEIYEGTSQVQRLVIARALLGPREVPA